MDLTCGSGVRVTVGGIVLAATVYSGISAVPVNAAEGTASASSETYLFALQAESGSTKPLTRGAAVDERFTLTLTGVDPVTMFADRPFRDSTLISPRALDVNWSSWFRGDPPNAVLTYHRPGKAPGSMVVALTNPRYSAVNRTLTFTAIRESRAHDPVEKGDNWQRLTTPGTFADGSLFIDGTGGNGAVGGNGGTGGNGSTAP
jgi:hypothetical protein